MIEATGRRSSSPSRAQWNDPTADGAIDDEPLDEVPVETVARPGDRGPTTVYYLHDADHTLLYVGITLSSRGLARMSQHAASKPWWADVAYASMEHHATRAAAEDREALAIANLNPLHNVQRPAVTTYGGIRVCACGCRRPSPPVGEGATRADCRKRLSRERR